MALETRAPSSAAAGDAGYRALPRSANTSTREPRGHPPWVATTSFACGPLRSALLTLRRDAQTARIGAVNTPRHRGERKNHTMRRHRRWLPPYPGRATGNASSTRTPKPATEDGLEVRTRRLDAAASARALRRCLASWPQTEPGIPSTRDGGARSTPSTPLDRASHRAQRARPDAPGEKASLFVPAHATRGAGQGARFRKAKKQGQNEDYPAERTRTNDKFHSNFARHLRRLPSRPGC